MSKPKATPAAEQFAALGLDPSAYTPAMQLAVKQKWAGLPVDKPVGELRAAVAAVTTKAVPSVTDLCAELAARGETGADLPDKAAVEQRRLKRNAAVNAWRERNQLQAALDARDLKFAALRAKKGSKVAEQPVAVAS